MKIKKTPKKLVAPAPSVKKIIQKLTDCQEDELPSVVASVPEWTFPRGDLFHWIGVLNRFDTILEDICNKYNLKKIQTTEFTPPTKNILLAILKFSRLLWENCTNRNLYSSYEHLNDLLNTMDLDVLESLLRLVLRPAQRLSNQRALRTSFTISQDRILSLTHSWGTKEYDLDLKDLTYDNIAIPEELTTLTYQFYRHLTPTEAAGTAVDKKHDTAIPSPVKQKRKDSASSGGATKVSEGVTLITINNLNELGATDIDILEHVIEEHSVPEEFHYDLLNRIRIATKITDAEKRRQMLTIRILAIAVMAHVTQEPVAYAKVFLYEPDLVASLADLIHPERHVPLEIQTVALYALEGISRYRPRLGEVLSAINAQVNHGILLYVLRRVIADLENEHSTYSQEYLDALFALISHIISTQTGGTMVIAAGIVPTLLQLLLNKNPSQTKNVTKAVILLDSLVYGFNPSFTNFCNASGVNILVNRIKDETNNSLSLARVAHGDQMEDVKISNVSSSTSISAKDEDFVLPYDLSSLLKSMLKFVLHMMQTSGTADGLRNLIETSLPESINGILGQPNVFGSSIYALAIQLMATFIHNEPTSLPIIQEAKLPQTFLKSICNDIPVSVDVIQHIPNAFGAICLNNQGLEIFKEANPIDKFFSIFTSTEHLRALQDNDLASVLGPSIDELMRHHPSLKPSIMNSIQTMLHRILELGQADPSTINDDTNRLHVGTEDEKHDYEVQMATESMDVAMTEADPPKVEDKRENTIVSFIEVAAKFLEGLFQNSSHSKEFIDQDGLGIILNFYSLPTLPYNFSMSAPSDSPVGQASESLKQLMRTIAENEPKRVIRNILTALNSALTKAKEFMDYTGKGGRLIEYIDLVGEDTLKLSEANMTFRSLITLNGLVGLISDLYYLSMSSHLKSTASIVEIFTADNEALSALGKLHRTCVWEGVILKTSLPKSWDISSTKPKKLAGIEPAQGTTSNNTTADTSKDVMETIGPLIDPNDRRVKNAKYFKYLVTEIPGCISRLLQGLSRMLYARKTHDVNMRKQAFKVSDTVAEILRDHLAWPRYALAGGSDPNADALNKYNYLTVMLGLLSLVYLDERRQINLQTMLAVSFDRIGGLECVLGLLRQFWDESQAIEEYSNVDDDENAKERETKLQKCLQMALSFLQFLSLSKVLHESQYTTSITSKERDRGSSEFFDPHEFLVNIRAKILPIIKDFWLSPYLEKAAVSVIRTIIQILVQILKAEGEVNQRPEGPSSFDSSFLFGTLVPNEEKVQQLIEMGFPRGAAETALIRCDNQVEAATEYLLTHPEATAEAIQAAEAAQAATESRDTTTDISADGTNQGTEANADTNVNQSIDAADGHQDMVTDTTIESTNIFSGLQDPNAVNLNIGVNLGDILSPDEGSSDAVVPMDMDTNAKKTEKGKEREVAPVELYKDIRTELKNTCAATALALLDNVEDVTFDVKDLFVLLSKNEFEKTFEFIKVIDLILSKESITGEQRQKALSSRLRLVALLVNDSSIQSKVPSLSMPLFKNVLQLILNQASLPDKDLLAPWLASALLIVEAFISLADEPPYVALETTLDESKEHDDLAISNIPISDDDRSALLDFSLNILERDPSNKDVTVALFRILVRLTRFHKYAVEFVQKNGLLTLLNVFKTRAHEFHRHHVYSIMIVRHIIEDSKVISEIMEREIKNWFSHPRSRVFDINNYLCSNSQLALRDPDLFIQSTTKLCKLTRYETTGRNMQISLVKTENSADPSEIDRRDLTIHEEEMMDVTASTSAPTSESPKKLLHSSEMSENLVAFIAGELMGIRDHQTVATEIKPSESSKQEDDIGNPTIIINGQSVQPEVKPLFKPEEHLDYLCRCFLLQCLTELVSSYPSCKMDVVNLSRRRNSTGVHASMRRTSLITHLLNDLLPYGCIAQTNDIEMRKKLGQSKMATSVLVALCSNNAEKDHKKLHPETAHARKFVIDNIIKSFTNAISSNDPIEAKYGRLLALAELCYAILTSRSTPSSTSTRPIEEGPTSIAKIMLDKNLVNTLTVALAEVDLNYPSSRILINALLRPFEYLTKIAIRMTRAPETETKDGDDQPRRDSISSITESSSEELSHEAEDAPDLYAHSALGVIEGRVESEEDTESIMGTSATEEAFDDEDYEEESDSDLSDDDLEEDEDRGDDMDIEGALHNSLEGDSDESDDNHETDEDYEEDDLDDHNDDSDDDEDHDDNEEDDTEDHEMAWEEPVMITREAIIDNDDDEHPRHVRHDRFGADEDDVTDDGIEDRHLFNWGWNSHNPLFMADDDLGVPVRTSRTLFSFGRRGRLGTGRRAILEVPPDNFDIIWGDSGDQGRFDYIGTDDLPGLGRSRPIINTGADDIANHPLLVNRNPNTSMPTTDGVRGRSSRSGHLSDLAQPIEEIISGGAVHILQQLFNRRHGLVPPTYRIELSSGSGGLISGIEVDRVINHPSSPQDATTSTSFSDPVKAIQELTLLSTSRRWFEEARMMYGNAVKDKAEARLRAEEERAQDTVMQQEGNEPAAQVLTEHVSGEVTGDAMIEDLLAREFSVDTTEAMEAELTTATETVATDESVSAQSATADSGEPSAELQQQRTTVMVNGHPVDITDTDIDPAFLEALPDELRQEVLSQHLPRVHARPTATEGSQAIDPQFLQALPDDVREDVLREQEEAERERRERERPSGGATAADMDPATFLATLEPTLRQTVLMEQDDMVLASLPPAIIAEANALRANRRYNNVFRTRTTLPGISPITSSTRKPTVHRDAMKLVDNSGLSTLVRLLFLPQPLGKNLLHKLLANLCENSKTRGELISMLLQKLQEGSGDVAAVDKSFAQMSLKNKGIQKSTPKKASAGSTPSAPLTVCTAGENVPNLVAQRCLESLTYIVNNNDAAVNYFLAEHETIIGLKRSNSRKGKEKQSKTVTSKYPVVALLSLLDKQVFIKNTPLMDSLMQLLSYVLRPLSTLAKSESSNAEKVSSNINSNESNLQSSNSGAETSIDSSDNVATTVMEGSNVAQPQQPQTTSNDPVQASDSTNQPPVSADNNTTSTEAVATSASPSKQSEQSQQPTLKPPVIPDYCLRLVVNVLTAGECTSNTFKYTQAVIQHLSTLQGARDVITSELVIRAQALGNEILDDLDELGEVLEQAKSGVDVQGVTLSKFSPSSSKQAKLLRVLKTVDYMYSRKQQQSATQQVEISLAPTVDPERPDTQVEQTSTNGAGTTKLTEDEEKVMNIYESLAFTSLWKKLGRCLSIIHEKSDMIHVATVLLPLIESLMVVCKYVGTPAAAHRTLPTGSQPATESMEELFFSFTENHRKILNTMVRNNPSLMSGSFSLLVHNPKILEFDNKRNYFNQQLHKRNGTRDHYGTLQLNVRRQYVFDDSFQFLQRRTGDEIKYNKLSVRFYDEEGVDAGGVTREWFQVLARQMFNEDYALFKTSAADRLTYQPNRLSGANPEHLLFFKFVGRVIGKAIYDGRLLDAYFTRSFYKHMLGKAVDYRDVEAIDLEYYNSLVWMLNNDITGVVDLTFSVEIDDFGQKKVIDLIANGRNIPVTEQNKREYVMLVTEQKLTKAIKDQIEAFLAGFHEIIPPHLIRIFNEQELELLISGMPDIDIDDWKNNTEYQNYTPSSPQIQWFWRAVRSFDQEERAKLLQFVTGTSKVPLGGFSVLQGVHGVQKFQIHKDFASADRLPSAHTCFNQLDIPEYESYEQLRSQLLFAISEGTTGFGFQ
ncbi:3553_t:CDS:10 [Paraglomus brasilianum]|uniref:HECT-type E3 ubiquitin transferase n=1 Tax=Paraglomus brasilianum TaxID=144538 RepID=A0A9N9F027_9GLOM|nr:3553_t:CDS:10 [Paraglomus brasilianum]